MHSFPVSQIIFRKIADVKKEQEHQRNEVTLSIPEDHPVRKLFQRFRQQRDAQPPAESHSYFDLNCVQVERHSDSNSYAQCQPVSPLQQEYSSPLQNNAPCSGGGGAAAAAPQALVHTVTSEHSGTREAGESAARPDAESQLRQRVSSPEKGSGAGGEGAVGGGAGSRGARGWAKFKNAASTAPPPPAAEPEKKPRKAEDWPKGSQCSELLAVANKNQDSEESGEMGSTEAGDEISALHKTDSCDSGITKSDLRIDRAGDSRSSFERSPLERSPLERSPLERSPFEHSLGVDSALKHSFAQPVSDQALLQATLHEAKLELKGDIQKLSGRLSVLESQVSEILRLLSMKRRLSLPPTASPKARVKYQDSVAASKLVTAKADDGPF
ncbi:Potassium voltage-gated channel subfamily H member 5 [Liparis tanakae]|uniref:Potassium voltage-gated channel subfamily H member 5 n=1 Tax=Liparis tanakae TaxID=230148 RepID=A0A4Z2IXE6_9TELE|nr:Potassium voltage-gated channel subfamily H member 5 [Liparis tanakae]